MGVAHRAAWTHWAGGLCYPGTSPVAVLKQEQRLRRRRIDQQQQYLTTEHSLLAGLANRPLPRPATAHGGARFETSCCGHCLFECSQRSVRRTTSNGTHQLSVCVLHYVASGPHMSAATSRGVTMMVALAWPHRVSLGAHLPLRSNANTTLLLSGRGLEPRRKGANFRENGVRGHVWFTKCPAHGATGWTSECVLF